MRSHLLSLLLLASTALAERVLSVLERTPELSRLNSFVRSSTDLVNLLNTETNFTLLAPSNDAIEEWENGDGTAATPALTNATLKYHLLRGRFPTIGFSEKIQFANSYLNAPRFTNVTAGQVVKLGSKNGAAQAVSGNNTVSTIRSPSDLICEGCLIQIINTVLEIPLDIIQSISEFGLKNFIAILSVGDFVSVADSPIIKTVLASSNITYFAPNTPGALASITAKSKKLTKDQLSAALAYHVVPGFSGYSSNLADGMKLKTFHGSEVHITIQNGQIFVNSAKVIATDFLLANGVLHTIDNFLNPLNITTPPPLVSKLNGTDNNNQDDELSGGAKAGIAFGTTLGVVIVASVAYMLYRREKRRVEQGATPRSVEGGGYARGGDYAQSSESDGEQRLVHKPTGDEHELDVNKSQRSAINFVVPKKVWEPSVDAVELDATSKR